MKLWLFWTDTGINLPLWLYWHMALREFEQEKVYQDDKRGQQVTKN